MPQKNPPLTMAQQTGDPCVKVTVLADPPLPAEGSRAVDGVLQAGWPSCASLHGHKCVGRSGLQGPWRGPGSTGWARDPGVCGTSSTELHGRRICLSARWVTFYPGKASVSCDCPKAWPAVSLSVPAALPTYWCYSRLVTPLIFPCDFSHSRSSSKPRSWGEVRQLLGLMRKYVMFKAHLWNSSAEVRRQHWISWHWEFPFECSELFFC